MDKYRQAKSLPRLAGRAHWWSLPQLRAWPSLQRATRDAVRGTSPVCASVLCGNRHLGRSACCSLHSTRAHTKDQELYSQCSAVRTGGETTGAAPAKGSRLHASLTEACFSPSSSSSPGRSRATPAGWAARGSVAALAGAGGLMDVFQAIQAQMQGMAASDEPPLADLDVSHLAFHPAGTHISLHAQESFDWLLWRLCEHIKLPCMHAKDNSMCRQLPCNPHLYAAARACHAMLVERLLQSKAWQPCIT